MKLLIVGCGNIGQRHLESILKISNVNIFIVEQNIKLLKKIQNKFSHRKIIFYKSIIETFKINIKFDYIIISTNSDNRFQILKKINHNLKVKHIILEKVAFINNAQFKYAIKSFKKPESKIFVNLPLRSINFFKKISQKNIKNFEMNIYGFNWNLFSNSIHYLDLFYFITNKVPKYLDQRVFKKIYKTKRPGYHEGYGEILFQTDCKKKITLSCKKDIKIKYKLFIELKINKKIYKFYTLNGHDFLNIRNNKLAYKVPFQSNLTHKQIYFLEKKEFNILPNLIENYTLQKEIFRFINILSKKIENNIKKKILIT